MRNTDFLSEYRNTLREWVNTETPTGDGERLYAFLRLLGEAFSSSGAQVSFYENENAPVLHARIGKGIKRCVLIGHADTVFPFGKAERFDEENGRFYGAGILDMKSGLFMMKKLFDTFHDFLPDDWQLEAVVNTDEESGSAKSERILKDLLKGASFAFVFEGSPEKRYTVQRKGILRFEISVKGAAAHASAGDPERKSAVYAMIRILSDLYAMKLSEGVTMNIGIVNAGSAVNVIADRARIEGELRAFSGHDLHETLDSITGIVSGYGQSIRLTGERPPMIPDERCAKLFEIARIAAEKKGYALESRIAGGGSDGAFARETGVPVLDGMGAEGARAHTRREYVISETIEKRFEIARETLTGAMRDFS